MVGGYQTRLINEGTAFETTAYRYVAGDGPTAVVVGGQHGIEPSGWLAAEHLLKDYQPASGALVVIPRMDPTAIAARAYVGDLGKDMNSSWPTNRTPSYAPVRELWNTIEEVDPDVVIDLHSSSGIYSGSPSGVGQAIFPTPDGSSIASTVCDRLTREYISGEYASKYAYSRGNLLSGNGTKLARKVRSDLGAMAFICEPTRHRTTLEDRIEWNLSSARYLLEECGMETQ